MPTNFKAMDWVIRLPKQGYGLGCKASQSSPWTNSSGFSLKAIYPESQPAMD